MKKIGSRFHTHIHSQKNSVFFYTEQHILLEIRNRVAKINHQPGQKKKETNKEISIIRTHTHATLVVRFCCCFFFTFCQRIEKNNNWKGIEREQAGSVHFDGEKKKNLEQTAKSIEKDFERKKKGALLSIGASDFHLVAVGEIIGGVGHVFQTLVQAEQVPAELVGHPLDALFSVRLAFRFHPRVFRTLVIHQTRLGVAVAVTCSRSAGWRGRRRGGWRGRRWRRRCWRRRRGHRRHGIDRRPSDHARSLTTVVAVVVGRLAAVVIRCCCCCCCPAAPDEFVLQRVEHRVETVQIGRLHVANHGASASWDASVQLRVAAHGHVHQLTGHHHSFVHVGHCPREPLHGEHDALLRKLARRVVERHCLSQRRIPVDKRKNEQNCNANRRQQHTPLLLITDVAFQFHFPSI